MNLNDRAQRHPPAENSDGRGSLKLRYCRHIASQTRPTRRVKKGDVIPNGAEGPVRNLLFSADDLNARAQRHPPAENRDGRGSLRSRS